jgi:hypothetical protein
LTRAHRLIAFLALAAVALVSCARLGSTGTNAQPADIFAAGPTVSDVRALFGDSNWWQGAPSFEVRPLDAATVSFMERYSITQRFIHIGSAEQLLVRYTVYDTTSSATTQMTNFQNAFGTSPTSPREGDQVLYYGLGGSGGAPYITRTFVRVGQVILQIIWSRKDGVATLQQLGTNAAKFVSGLKKAMAAKVHASPPGVDPKLLPPAGLDITFLGAAQLPIEAWLIMDQLAIPAPLATQLHSQGVNNFVFGDFALNNDTHMEVQAAVLTFMTATEATDWANNFSTSAPDQTGISTAYIPGSGVEGAGEYHVLFAAGTHGAMLVCRATVEGEAASRACEGPQTRTALAWKLSLGG